MSEINLPPVSESPKLPSKNPCLLSFQVGHASWNVKNAEVRTKKNKKFVINPYLRYTFLKLDKVNVFVDGGLEYVHSDKAGAKNNSFGIGVRPGVAVNLNDKLSFVTHFGWLGYKNSKDDKENAKAANTFGLNLSSKVSFGIYYNF